VVRDSCSNMCFMQGDGNLVIYNNGTPTWWSGTHGNPGGSLSVIDSGAIAIYDQNGNLRKLYGIPVTGVLKEHYFSANRQYVLVFQGDGNLVLYGSSGALWWTGTIGSDLCAMQGDGNLVIYNNGTPTWSSGTPGNPGAHIAVQDTGAVGIFDKNGNMIKSYSAVNKNLELVTSEHLKFNDFKHLFKSP